MSKDSSLPGKYKQAILNIIFKRLNREECVVFLFGTYAEGSAIRSSDIDIGILSKHKISDKDFVEIQEELNNNVLTLRKIDFVDFASVNEDIKKEALKEIELWHTGKNCQGLLKNLKQA